MKRGIYRGPLDHLKGEPALVREHVPDPDPVWVEVQFDNFQAQRAGTCLASGWHAFHRSDFEFPDDGILGRQS